MAKPQKWPIESRRYYLEISHLQERLSHMLSLSVVEGIENQNYQLIELLLPFIYDIGEDMIAECRRLQGLLPRKRRGRLPKWATIGIDIRLKAEYILRRLEQINELYPSGRFINIALLLRLSRTDAQGIRELLDAHPPELEEIPETFRSVIDEVIGDQ